jgi:UDP-N-acetylglucosamine 1-carboxyvinyltransferase
MMAALNSEGITVIRNAAKEPEIREFACFLRSMGASVEGDGTDRIMIQGKEELHDTVYTLGGDRIVAGTYMAACAAAGGAIRLEGIHADACHGFLEVFEQMGCSLTCGEGFVEMQKNESLRMPACITTEPYPGFPTDMQPQLMSLMCMADGNGVIRENIFENRLRNAAELVKTGADIRVEENTAYIRGVERLHGAKMISYDLRGGAALIVAGLAAKGQTVVEDKGYIDRGYEDIRRDLCLLGAHII